MIVVGAWTEEEYLEEIEPAIAGRFRYIYVPPWKDDELRQAARQWAARSEAPAAITARVDGFLDLAAGDISLFRSLVETLIERSEAAPVSTADSAAGLNVQELILGRFRRSLRTKLRAILSERDAWVRYDYVKTTPGLLDNPEFRPLAANATVEYRQITVDPETKQPYPGGRQGQVDDDGNPQYLLRNTVDIGGETQEVLSFLMWQFHAAVQNKQNSIPLATLADAFQRALEPPPLGFDAARVKAIFAGFAEVQREALIVPGMLAINSAGDAMEIVDRRLFLFLQSVTEEDLRDLLDSIETRRSPNPRRRNRLSAEMSSEEKAAKIAQLGGDSQSLAAGKEADEDDDTGDDSDQANDTEEVSAAGESDEAGEEIVPGEETVPDEETVPEEIDAPREASTPPSPQDQKQGSGGSEAKPGHGKAGAASGR
jgi:hypothetical protein